MNSANASNASTPAVSAPAASASVARRRIGGFEVAPIGLGAMPSSLGKDPLPPHDQAIATIHAALDAGITLIDTADIYAPAWDAMGHNERIVAEGLRTWSGDTDGVVVASKGGITRGEGETWGRDGSPTYLRAAVERSLENLGTDAIDLYYWHRPDRSLRYADVIETLARLQADGLIREIGISNANVEEIDVAIEVLGEGGLAAVQNQFSPTFHHTSRAELDRCAAADVAFVPWSPLGGISGHAGTARRFPAIARIAEDHGISPQQVVLAWELGLSDRVIPIPGASRPASIADSASAMTLTLTDAEQQALRSIFGETDADGVAFD